jgi:hypothetical protein
MCREIFGTSLYEHTDEVHGKVEKLRRAPTKDSRRPAMTTPSCSTVLLLVTSFTDHKILRVYYFCLEFGRFGGHAVYDFGDV